MARQRFEYVRVSKAVAPCGKTITINSVSKKDYEKFNSSLLGLGDISREGEYVQALAAFLDLQGFTSFCNQVDAHLVIPVFLQQYINWLFAELREEFKESEDTERVFVWGSLPIFSKFLGDGILFIWDTTIGRGPASVGNVALNLDNVCQSYKNDFLPKVSQEVSKPPSALRCGIARGQIISVGDGQDFVGPCINVAARLQKLSQLTFAISKRGFDLSEAPKTGLWLDLILKRVVLPGIGDEELVYVKKSELDLLPSAEQALFKDL